MDYINGSSGPTMMDIVNLASFRKLREAIDPKILNIVRARVPLDGVMRDVYQIGTINILRDWESIGGYGGDYRRAYSEPTSPGYWVDTYFNRRGEDVISLKLHLSQISSLPRSDLLSGCSSELLQEAAAQFQPQASKQSVVDDLVKRLGIDIHEPKIGQPAAFRGWSQVPWASESSPKFGINPEEDGARTWPDCRPDLVPFFGPPRQKFEMRDPEGRLQQIVGAWPMKEATHLFFSFTLWHKDRDPLIQTWKFGRSAIKTCPYGLLDALANKDATIVIDDDLFTVDRENPVLIKHHGAAPPIIFVAWPRGLDESTPADTDWTQLRDRKILIAVGNDRDSFVNALALNDELLNVGAGSIEFALPKDFAEGTGEITVDRQGGELRGVRKDVAELAMIAKERFDISPKTGKRAEISSAWKIGDTCLSSGTYSIVTPLFEKGALILVYSEAGVGKSRFAIHITHALATGGKLLDRFQATNRYRCLYLAGETVSRICQRIEDIPAAMPGCDATNIVVYPHTDQKFEKLNLECDEGWKKIEALTDKADVIIIDHLTAFTSGRNSPESWYQFYSHLRRLTQRGKTILLLHHAGKNGQQRGTSILDDDIDMKIRLERSAKFENEVLVTFEKHRDDQTLGKALQPFRYRWGQGPNGQLYWWIVDAEPSATKDWAPLPETNNDHVRSVDEAYIVANFEGREPEIIRCLATALLKGKPGLGRQEIDRQLGVSGSTTRSVLEELVAKGSVVIEGKGRATRYALSDGVMQSVIHD